MVSASGTDRGGPLDVGLGVGELVLRVEAHEGAAGRVVAWPPRSLGVLRVVHAWGHPLKTLDQEKYILSFFNCVIW